MALQELLGVCEGCWMIVALLFLMGYCLEFLHQVRVNNMMFNKKMYHSFGTSEKVTLVSLLDQQRLWLSTDDKYK